jgi:hypothetical protein
LSFSPQDSGFETTTTGPCASSLSNSAAQQQFGDNISLESALQRLAEATLMSGGEEDPLASPDVAGSLRRMMLAAHDGSSLDDDDDDDKEGERRTKVTRKKAAAGSNGVGGAAGTGMNDDQKNFRALSGFPEYLSKLFRYCPRHCSCCSSPTAAAAAGPSLPSG